MPESDGTERAPRKDSLTALRAGIGLACIPLLYGYGRAFGELLSAALGAPERYTAFLIGMALAGVAWGFWLRGKLSFWETFEHEATHALFGVMCLKPIRAFKATRGEGGYLEMEGGNLLVRLAPYFFPTVVMVPLLLKPIVAAEFVPYVHAAAGAALFFHAVSTVHETHRRQSDLVRTGLILSASIIGVLHLVCIGVILTIVGYGYAEVAGYLGGAFVHIWQIFT